MLYLVWETILDPNKGCKKMVPLNHITDKTIDMYYFQKLWNYGIVNLVVTMLAIKIMIKLWRNQSGVIFKKKKRKKKEPALNILRCNANGMHAYYMEYMH